MKAHTPYNGRSCTGSKADRKPAKSKSDKKKKKRLKLLTKMFPMISFAIFKFPASLTPSRKRRA